jgi:hypothetical protein
MQKERWFKLEVWKKADEMALMVYNRYRFWAPVQELGGRFLRVVTLEDKLTIHNAFPDRNYKP